MSNIRNLLWISQSWFESTSRSHYQIWESRVPRLPYFVSRCPISSLQRPHLYLRHQLSFYVVMPRSHLVHTDSTVTAHGLHTHCTLAPHQPHTLLVLAEGPAYRECAGCATVGDAEPKQRVRSRSSHEQHKHPQRDNQEPNPKGHRKPAYSRKQPALRLDLAIDEYERDLARRAISAETIRNYRKVLDLALRFWQDRFGRVPTLDDVTVRAGEAFLDHLRERGQLVPVAWRTA